MKIPMIPSFQRAPILNSRRVKGHASKLFQFLFERPFPGEVFLCGGAYKPLLDSELKINNLDLWVRNRAARQHLVTALINNGAEQVREFAPHFIEFGKEGTAISVSYRDAGDAGLAGIVDGFDLAACAIGVAYENGSIEEVCISERIKRSLKERTVLLQDSYLPRLREEHDPGLLCGLDRMQQLADETGFDVDEKTRSEMWEIFELEYSPEEKQDCLDTYMETIVSHKSRCDAEVLRRASDLVLEN